MYRESSGWLILQKENAMYFGALIHFQGKQLPHYHLTSISIGGLILKSKIFPLRADPIFEGAMSRETNRESRNLFPLETCGKYRGGKPVQYIFQVRLKNILLC